MAKILNVASYLPKEKITNEDLSKNFKEWTSDKIFEKTGIKNRYKSQEGETAADLALKAAEKVFKNSAISRDEIDLLINILFKV